jgi:hypothetical protein
MKKTKRHRRILKKRKFSKRKKRRRSQNKRKKKKKRRRRSQKKHKNRKKHKGGMRFKVTQPFLATHGYDRSHIYDCPACTLSLAGIVTCEVGAELAKQRPWGVDQEFIKLYMKYEFPQFIWEWKPLRLFDTENPVSEEVLQPGDTALIIMRQQTGAAHYAAIANALDENKISHPVILDPQATDMCTFDKTRFTTKFMENSPAAPVGVMLVKEYMRSGGFVRDREVLDPQVIGVSFLDSRALNNGEKNKLYIQPKWKFGEVPALSFKDVLPGSEVEAQLRKVGYGRHAGRSKSLWQNTIRYRKEFMIKALRQFSNMIKALRQFSSKVKAEQSRILHQVSNIINNWNSTERAELAEKVRLAEIAFRYNMSNPGAAMLKFGKPWLGVGDLLLNAADLNKIKAKCPNAYKKYERAMTSPKQDIVNAVYVASQGIMNSLHLELSSFTYCILFEPNDLLQRIYQMYEPIHRKETWDWLIKQPLPSSTLFTKRKGNEVIKVLKPHSGGGVDRLDLPDELL